MPLIDLKTDLKSLKFGRDRKGGGNSLQPYIQNKIPETPFEEAITSPLGVKDFLLRGGLNAVTDTAEDVLRLGKMFLNPYNPSGLLFTAKQNLLSRTAVRTQTSGILNEGTYTPLSTLSQAGVNAFGGHLNKQGVNPFTLTGAYSNNNSLYGVRVKPTQLPGDNRLVILKTLVDEGNSRTLGDGDTVNEGGSVGVNVLSYGGGPGSDLGIGRTNIRYADQRTGNQNALVSSKPGYFYGTPGQTGKAPFEHGNYLQSLSLLTTESKNTLNRNWNTVSRKFESDFGYRINNEINSDGVKTYYPSVYKPGEGNSIKENDLSSTFTQGSGANVSVSDGNSAVIYCDGAGATAAVVDLTATFPAAGALLAANNLSDVANAGTSRTNLGVAIGTDVLAYDSNLQTFVSAFTLPTSDGTSGQAITTNGTGTLSFADAGISTGKAIAMAIVFG